MTPFDGNIFVAGCGAVAQCALPILLKELSVDPSRITIMDFVDNRARVKEVLDQGVIYTQDRITKDNYTTILSKYLKPSDIFIDLSTDIDTMTMLQWCHDNNVRYVNSSVELWEPYHGAHGKDPRELTLYTRQMKIRNMVNSWQNKKGATAILDHGANPGLVSHFTKEALEDIANKLIKEKPKDNRAPQLQEALSTENFAKIAQLLGVKTIHISERDSQITNDPKKINEFVNTWSVAGIYEEGVAPSELGWGTHERYAPEGIMFHQSGPENQVCLETKGIETFVRSWVPSGEIIGMVIRHGEAFGISDRLTVWENNKAIYRPTVHYAYCVSDATQNSLYELKMRQLEIQPKQRIMYDEIIDGIDELGCLLMGHDYKAWWIGSLLDIHESRRLVSHQNATTVQVAISVVAAVHYLMKHPNEGVCLPDDLNHHEILTFSKPYLGPFISQQVDWSPLQRKQTYLDYSNNTVKSEDEWQFISFLAMPYKKIQL